MKKNYTHTTIVLDRSGSMSSIQKDMEGGLRQFIESQQKEEVGEMTVSYHIFDTEFERVFDFVNVKDINLNDLVLNPRGGTALLDGVGMSISLTGEYLRKMKEEDRPELVTMFIITDGGENASREFNSEQLKTLVKTQEEEFSWVFNYLGANQDAFQEAGGFGLKASSVSNFSLCKADMAFDSYSKKMSTSRSALASGSYEVSGFAFSDQDRSELE